MTLRVSDLQSDIDLDSIHNSCDFFSILNIGTGSRDFSIVFPSDVFVIAICRGSPVARIENSK